MRAVREALRWLASVALSFGLIVTGGWAEAQTILAVPDLTGPVVDQASILDPAQRQALEAKLRGFEDRKGTQIVVLLVPTTQPEDIAAFANRVGSAWKIGRQSIGDGILIVVAREDRRARIEVAKALEGAVPDLAARQIIDEAMAPRFRESDFSGGLEAGIDQLIARVSGEALPAPPRSSNGRASEPGFDWLDLAVFLFVAVQIASAVLKNAFGNRLGSVLTGVGASLFTWFVTSSVVVAFVAGGIGLVLSVLSIGWHGRRPHTRWGADHSASHGAGWGGDGWGGGGGFSSGGGGDFGGGGASGDW